MENNFFSEEHIESLKHLNKLKEKYSNTGQDFHDYLQGLLYSKGLSYWEYLNTKSLLGLQNTRTNFNDEIIFIVYHQITELYFKLIKHEIDSLIDNKEYLNPNSWIKRIGRCSNYFRKLIDSFDIMFAGLDKDEFGKFRMALLPASGFQSLQFREIEIMSTNLSSLIYEDKRSESSEIPAEILYENIYWKSGGINNDTKDKTMTLLEFEEQYDKHLIQLIKARRFLNLNYLYVFLDNKPQALENTLREFDELVNVHWKLSHLTAAAEHLPSSDTGTGGTNWRKYLPARFQRIQFFPTIWNAEEKEEWGKSKVMKVFNDKYKSNWMKKNTTSNKVDGSAHV